MHVDILCKTVNIQVYTMDHLDLTVSNFIENSIGLKSVKEVTQFEYFLDYQANPRAGT